ncbi:MAG TPA: PEP/pyruvate-binding domain-containing protein [Spirochaetota bacterium]|nr:PEP/pyruvate-binding domain-containing protein [Spirochaetota bacterium]
MDTSPVAHLSERAPIDPEALRIPVAATAGALSRVSGLIEELKHPNTDWKAAVDGLRAYLYDYLYEIAPHARSVLPTVFHFLREATARRKASTLRAADTVFDRYAFAIRRAADGDDALAPVAAAFDEWCPAYLDLLIGESDDNFYYGPVNARAMALRELILRTGRHADGLPGRVGEFLLRQYGIFISHAIRTTRAEIDEIVGLLDGTEESRQFALLLEAVSEEAYADRLSVLAARLRRDPTAALSAGDGAPDFAHNARTWERICLSARRAIEEGRVSGDDAVLRLIAFITRKSAEGRDAELQRFMSRTAATICAFLVDNRRLELIRSVIDLVMPPLLAEAERGAGFYSAFSTITMIGETIIASGITPLVDYFVDILVHSKFCFPEFRGIAADWSVTVNASHLENIRTWMRLIELNPALMKKLAASLIVNLKLGGVFLKDTDVFQRDISRLLRSDYREAFHLITSLAAVFPAFYHDIGATGDIRAFTERIDTNHEMNDLIHFIRKQVHVESSSRTVHLVQRVMEFWMTGDRSLLSGLVPDEVYRELDGFYRMVNLDREGPARAIVDAARRAFPEHAALPFWDFLLAVGRERFTAFVAEGEIAGVSRAERDDAAACFASYFETRNPAEMTVMLELIRNKFGVDVSKQAIWAFLYEISDEEFRDLFGGTDTSAISSVNIEKFITFLHVYRMLYDKYNFSDVRCAQKLRHYADEELFEAPEGFFELLDGADTIAALEALLALQHTLKNDILLGEKTYEPVDTIEFKRHIAFGIPSMYGSYKEKKFDTLKVFFHLNLVRLRLFETVIERLADLPTGIDYPTVKTVLTLFFKTFIIDGLANQEMVMVSDLLSSPHITVAQFRDIVTNLHNIHGEIADQFNETFTDVCRQAIGSIGIDNIAAKYIPRENPQSIDVIIDRFLRDQIMQSPLLQLMDNLLIRLKDYLTEELYNRGDFVCLNGSQPRFSRGRNLFPLRVAAHQPPEGTTHAPVWKVGAKGHGLVFAANMDGIAVPEGFVLSTELFKRIRDGSVNNPRFRRKVIYSLRRYVDAFTGGRFANPRDPVLLSVRSGAVFSMPGVMDTITNIGITQEIIDHFAARDPWFAYDCYRRLIQDFAISTYGIDRSVFENLMQRAKDEAGVPLKEKLTGAQMEALTRKYRYVINKHSYSIPKDPYTQLFYAIIAVYRSWESTIAKNYRRFVNLSDAWGTAVIVQKMVFGNYSPTDITGVVHSAYLGRENISLFGEYKTRAQGHDIVSGVAKVFPISEEQKWAYPRLRSFVSLEKEFPETYRLLFDTVRRIRQRWGNDVEIEFTLENGVLYILQIRGMVKHAFETEELVGHPDELQDYLLGQGLAASGGAVSGRVVFDIDRIDLVRGKYAGDKIILVRPETNPEDVIGLEKSDGILTCIGGMTSHAVLQMRRLEKSGVSDFSIMRIDEENRQGIITNEDPEEGITIIREGDFITIDGATGHVYLGYHRTRKKTYVVR